MLLLCIVLLLNFCVPYLNLDFVSCEYSEPISLDSSPNSAEPNLNNPQDQIPDENPPKEYLPMRTWH